jgi:signal peptidase I
MAPTLVPGDCLYVDPHAYRQRPPARGEVVVVRDPALPARHLVKRVGFVPGETVPPAGTVVPPGSVYLVGDAPHQSRDSREFGPVPLGSVVGRAYRCYRPIDRRRDL